MKPPITETKPLAREQPSTEEKRPPLKPNVGNFPIGKLQNETINQSNRPMPPITNPIKPNVPEKKEFIPPPTKFSSPPMMETRMSSDIQ